METNFDFNEIDFDDLEEIEEVVTPSQGTYLCCTV